MNVILVICVTLFVLIPAESHGETITYYISNGSEPFPPSMLESAFNSWEILNDGLNFVEGNHGSMSLIFKNNLSNKLGEALCISNPYMERCFVFVALRAHDCNDELVYLEEQFLTNIVSHELGHVLGINHSSDKDHLMFGYAMADDNMQGYAIPDKLPEWFVGEEEVYSNMTLIESKLKPLQKIVESKNNTHVSYMRDVTYMDGLKTQMENMISGSEPDKQRLKMYQNVIQGYESSISRYDEFMIEYEPILDEYERLSMLYSEIQNTYQCFPYN